MPPGRPAAAPVCWRADGGDRFDAHRPFSPHLEGAAGTAVGIDHHVGEERVVARLGEGGFDEPAPGRSQIEDLGAARVTGAQRPLPFPEDGIELPCAGGREVTGFTRRTAAY